MLKLRVSGPRIDMKFVRAWEEVKYELRMSVLIEKIMSDEIDTEFSGVSGVGLWKMGMEANFERN